jgi:hypothetical protein
MQPVPASGTYLPRHSHPRSRCPFATHANKYKANIRRIFAHLDQRRLDVTATIMCERNHECFGRKLFTINEIHPSPTETHC